MPIRVAYLKPRTTAGSLQAVDGLLGRRSLAVRSSPPERFKLRVLPATLEEHVDALSLTPPATLGTEELHHGVKCVRRRSSEGVGNVRVRPGILSCGDEDCLAPLNRRPSPAP
jgi:hypothetical protein